MSEEDDGLGQSHHFRAVNRNLPLLHAGSPVILLGKQTSHELMCSDAENPGRQAAAVRDRSGEHGGP